MEAQQVEPVLVGDEVSRAGTSIHRLREHAYDAFTKRQTMKAIELYSLIEQHAHNATIALLAGHYLTLGEEGMARELMAVSYKRDLAAIEVEIRERPEDRAKP